MVTRTLYIAAALFLWLPAQISVAAAPESTYPVIKYDLAKDRLTVLVNQLPLAKVLAHTAMATGIDIKLDKQADRLVTTRIDGMPLERAMASLLRGTSYVFFYRDSKSSRKSPNSLLTGIDVLPRGKHDSGNLKPVVTLSSEALIHAQLPGRGLASQRWQYRWNQLPEAKQKRLEKYVAYRQQQKKERQARKEKKSAEFRRKREEIAKRANKAWGTKASQP